MILAEELTKRVGGRDAVSDVSFRVEPGQILCLVSDEPAAGTTTLRMVLGLVRPTAGRALVLDTPYEQLEDPARRVGVALGDDLHPRRTVRDHLRIAALGVGASDARVDQVLELAGLRELAGTRTARLEPSDRQRLRVAAALVAEPEVLVLDQPDRDLDPDAKTWLGDTLRDVAGDGCTVLCSYHPRSRLIDRANAMLVLDDGAVAGRERRHGHAPVGASKPKARDEERLRGTEEAVVEELGALEVGTDRVVTVAQAGPGRGGTTVALLLAASLTRATDARVLVVALSSDPETLRDLAGTDRTPLRVTDLLGDLGGFDERARIDPYVSPLAAGPDLLAGWSATDRPGDLHPRQVADLVAFAQRFYDVVVLDVGDAPDLALTAALRAGEVALVVDEADDADDAAARDVAALVRDTDERPLLHVVNRCDWDAAQDFALRGTDADDGACIPTDPALQRAFATSRWDAGRLARTTRVAADRLAVEVLGALG